MFQVPINNTRGPVITSILLSENIANIDHICNFKYEYFKIVLILYLFMYYLQYRMSYYYSIDHITGHYPVPTIKKRTSA